MSVFLQAYAEKSGSNKLKVVLKVVHDFSTVEQKTFLLPDAKSAFINFTEELYNRPDKPTYVSKSHFKENFIDYTLSLSYSNVAADEVTDHYNDVAFKISEEDANKIIGLAGDHLDSIAAGMQASMDAKISAYEAAKENNITSANDFGYPALAVDPINDPLGEETSPPPGDGPGTITSGESPSTANERPVKDMSGISINNASTLTNLPEGVTGHLRGIAGDRLIEPVPAPLLYPGDANMECENNAGVIFGRDEYYRLRGHTKSGACYLYAGRSPNNIQATALPPDGVGPPYYVQKPNDLIRDAAYLYLSQKADVDSLLKVAQGTFGKAVQDESQQSMETRKGFSLAAIKADDVVIMARESGIRLITGMDQTNSRGGELSSKFGIDLIAGNNDEDLQPLVKGSNLVQYLTGLSKAVDELRAIVYSFITSQIDMNSVLAEHKHYDPFAIFLGSMATGNPLGFNEGKNFISVECVEAGTKALLDASQMQRNTISQMQNRINNDTNGLSRTGTYKIISEKNRTN
jgi:hypothetical protein